ncbi:MAG: tetratricopeptide repeat protein, partial [Bryobacterales bacterium]|nr:tetratricopeptide repeat protein [Bryobacterales bacterium]
RKMYREAIEMYRQAPQSSAAVHNKLGIAFHQLTDLRQAKKQYERAAKLNPKYAEALNSIGTVYYALTPPGYRQAVAPVQQRPERRHASFRLQQPGGAIRG